MITLYVRKLYAKKWSQCSAVVTIYRHQLIMFLSLQYILSSLLVFEAYFCDSKVSC